MAKTDFWREEGNLRKRRSGVIMIVLAMAAAAVAFIVYRLWPARKKGEGNSLTGAAQGPPPEGLSEAEAAARLDPEHLQDNVISGKPAISRKQIVRQTIFTIFNLNLILLGLIQIVFVRPLDGLITIGIIIVNVVANVFQYELAQRRLKALQEAARPDVTVMRDGKARSVDPREIVVGDVIAAGRGDQIIADGPLLGEGSLLLDETMLGGGRGSVRKRSGDPLLAGSIVLNGRAAYRADVLGDQRQVIRYLQSLPAPEPELTTIEKILNRIMRFLLLMMITLTVYGLLRAFNLEILGTLTAETADPFVVILNLAPASLFFMVLLTYVSSTADLAKIGALVKQSRSVETLAQLDVLCLAKTGFLTGIGVDLQPISAAEDAEEIAVPRMRQILGDFAHSSAGRDPVMRALAANFPGAKRTVVESAPFLSAYGWSAVIFDDQELKGIYVLAEPQLFDLQLAGQDAVEGEEEAQKEEGRSLTGSLAAVVRNPLARFRRRNKDGEAPSEEEGPEPPQQSTAAVEPAEQTAAEVAGDALAEPPKKGLFGRLTATVRGTVGSVGSLISRDQEEKQEEKPLLESEDEGVNLIFAYNAQQRSLETNAGDWQLPAGLVPLCRLRFEEKVRPEARDSINHFSRQGVAVKIFTSVPPQDTAARLREAGVNLGQDAQLTAVDGPQLEGLAPAELAALASTNTVFGSLSPQKAAAVVRALLESGQSVGMAGHGVSDAAALRAAELAIVRKDSSPAVLGLGDIVLLDEDPSTLSRVVEKGQRIVNGLVDILKLYLTQIFYLLILIVAIPLTLGGFPYTSQQAGLINLITLTIPALALTLWAGSGKLPRAKLSQVLRNFVAPAAISTAILGYLVYRTVLQQGNSLDTVQNVLTYALVLMGLLLVVMIKPPVHIRITGLPQAADIRPTIMVVLAAVVFMIIARIPFFAEMFGIAPLENAAGYVLVAGSGLIWMILVNLTWRLFPVAARVGGAVTGGLQEAGKDFVEEGLQAVSGET